MSDTMSRFLSYAPFATASTPMPGHELVDLGALGFIPSLGGAERGYNVEADTLITQTTDGRDLNSLWEEFRTVVGMHNEKRQTLIDLLTFPVQNVIEDVPQIGGDDFEEASEFGVPKGIRSSLTYFSMGYDFKWYDLAARFTWKFLAEASAQQVESIHQSALEADNRLIFRKVMGTLFRNTNRAANIKGQNYTVYALYNADGTVPPEYAGNTFDGTHSHYLVSGAAAIDPGDLEESIEHLRHHGYSAANGTDLVFLMNETEARVVRNFRAGTNGATYDFVPAVGSPAMIVPNQQGLIGAQTGDSYKGLTVIGSYGPARIVAEDYIPSGYVVLLGTGGAANLQNPIGIREHANTGLRGLRLIAGDRAAYPLVNSYYNRGFGTGIRQRGGAVVTQIKASGGYTIPTAYQNA
ncbi:MAG: hypothetical protein WBC29_01790 [Candidatus Moraniibacteriota bacterium]